MPTYEYECVNGHAFEEFQSIVAAPVEVCPICGGKVQRKISGGTGLIFKGTGFYLTDYGRKSSSPADSHHTKKTESKPEATPAKTESTPKPTADGGKSGSA
jgi:putative FmdB family regulatory protein